MMMKIGTAPQLATCAAGTVFNPKTSRCDPPIHNLECISITSQTPSTSRSLQDLTRQSRARRGRSSRRMRKRGERRQRKSTFRRSRRMSRHCRWPHYKMQTPSQSVIIITVVIPTVITVYQNMIIIFQVKQREPGRVQSDWRGGHFGEQRPEIKLIQLQTKAQTRSSWLNCALRDDEAVYWVSIGHYEPVAVGN